jgi:para-nitrobenzyl esterase
MHPRPESPGRSRMARRTFLRRSTAFGAAAVTAAMTPWRSLAAAADRFPVVETTCGRVRGMDVAGINTFRGIRYGADTSGSNRFMPPVKAEPWSDVFEAFAYGPAAPQMPGNPTDAYTQAVEWDAHVKTGVSEDCLRLNVWTPGLGDGGGRPVCVYLHGGGFTSGSGGLVFDGDPLARLGDVVVVTVNHRLGPLGFLDLGSQDAPKKFATAGVVGMLDLVAALEWVRDNVAHFGGDPESVMIFGQSGGGAKVSTLMAMPAAKGLFHKAAVQSGSTITLRPRDEGAKQVTQLLEELDVDNSNLEALQQVPWDKLVAAEANRGFGPIVDGAVIPGHPFDPAAPELSADVPLIVGYTREDAGIRNLAEAPPSPDKLQEWAKQTFGERADKVLATYRRVYPTATPEQLQARMSTDSNTRRRATTMVERKAAQGRAAAFLYVISWPSPAFEGRFGAVHGVDLGLVLANPRNPIAGNTVEARQLAEVVGSGIAAFAKTGDPNCDQLPHWPAYDSATRATMIFDAECRVENDPTGELRQLWVES